MPAAAAIPAAGPSSSRLPQRIGAPNAPTKRRKAYVALNMGARMRLSLVHVHEAQGRRPFGRGNYVRQPFSIFVGGEFSKHSAANVALPKQCFVRHFRPIHTQHGDTCPGRACVHLFTSWNGAMRLAHSSAVRSFENWGFVGLKTGWWPLSPPWHPISDSKPHANRRDQ